MRTGRVGVGGGFYGGDVKVDKGRWCDDDYNRRILVMVGTFFVEKIEGCSISSPPHINKTRKSLFK